MIKKIFAAAVLLISTYAAQAQTNYQHCATMQMLDEQKMADPNLQSRMDAIEEETNVFIANYNQSQNKTSAVITIPTVFHVLYNTSSQNISDARILAQLDVLNKDFARLNADAGNTPSVFQGVAVPTNIQFCLAQRDPNGNATNGINRVSTTKTSFGSSGDPMKFSSSGGVNAWPTGSYLNIWVCNLSGGLLGYAQFPGGSASTDGVVVLFGSVGGPGTPGTSTPYHLGRTATHEVGHWLNLRHIWGDATCGNDLVSDTPTQQTSNFGCPSFPKVTCSNGPNGDMFMNYMDYTDDACMNMFTAGQSTRMDAVLAGSRASLTTSLGCTPPNGGGCGTAAGLASSGVTQTGATLSWGAVSGATSYNVQYRVVGATSWTSITSATTSVAISGLSAGTNYQFQVQAVCSGTTGAWSGAATFTTQSAGGGCNGDPYESNNSSSTFKQIAVNTDIYALIGSSTDKDWFRITTVSPATRVKVTLTNLPFDYDLRLYNNSNSLLASSELGGTANEQIIYNATTATSYKIRVVGYSGAFSTSQCYVLRANTSSTNFKVMGSMDHTGKAAYNDLSAYPNPSRNEINLMFNSDIASSGAITVSDIYGKQLFATNITIEEGTNTPTVNISHLNTGIYFVTVTDGVDTYKIKVVKE
ncbi:MAG: fibronectin type III domain-containing protein [Bacteroidetes bacterium]|nr:fibronectin type III domain-containing protein [Bacteroidota bacterium]